VSDCGFRIADATRKVPQPILSKHQWRAMPLAEALKEFRSMHGLLLTQHTYEPRSRSR